MQPLAPDRQSIHEALLEAGFTEGTTVVRLRRALAELEELRDLSSEVTKAFRVEAIHHPPAPIDPPNGFEGLSMPKPGTFRCLTEREAEQMSPAYAPGDGARGLWAVLSRLFRRCLRACRDILGGMLTQRDIDLADVNEAKDLLEALGFKHATLHERVEAAVNEIKLSRGPKFRLLPDPPDEKA